MLGRPRQQMRPFAGLLNECMYMSDERDERHVGPHREQDRVIDLVRREGLTAAGRRRRERDELLLESLDGVVDLIYDVPEVANEAEEGDEVRTAASCKRVRSEVSRSAPEKTTLRNSRVVTCAKTR